MGSGCPEYFQVIDFHITTGDAENEPTTSPNPSQIVGGHIKNKKYSEHGKNSNDRKTVLVILIRLVCEVSIICLTKTAEVD